MISSESPVPNQPDPNQPSPSDSVSVTNLQPQNVVDRRDAQGRDRTFQGFWPVFLSTFVTIFLAEVGDKTQVTTLLMSAESQAPLVVFLGAASALVSTSLMGVLLGKWLATRVSEDTLDTCAGILLLLITIGLVADIVVG